MKSRGSAALAVIFMSAVSAAKELPVPVVAQHTPDWCWAASGQMVMNYLGDPGVQQCQEANHATGRTDCCNSPVPAACVQGGYPDWNFYNFSYAFSPVLSFSQLQAEIDAGRPFYFSWSWTGGGSHAMVVVGYKVINGVNYVTINNPLPVDQGSSYDLTYDAWVKAPDHTHQGDSYNVKDTPVCGSDFNNMPANQFQACFDYQTQRGRWPVTLSAYYSAGTLELAGSFQPGANRPVRTLMTASQFQSYFNTYQAQGFRPGQVTVVSTPSGPLFTAIWTPVDGAWTSLMDMTEATFVSTFNQKTTAGYLIDDLYAYEDNGTKYVATWVKKPNGGFYAYSNMTAADYNTHFNQLNAQGFRPTRFNAYQTAAGLRYAAIWQKSAGAFYMYYAMAPSSYQTMWNNMYAAGFHLAELTGLDDVLAAVWTK